MVTAEELARWPSLRFPRGPWRTLKTVSGSGPVTPDSFELPDTCL